MSFRWRPRTSLRWAAATATQTLPAVPPRAPLPSYTPRRAPPMETPPTASSGSVHQPCSKPALPGNGDNRRLFLRNLKCVVGEVMYFICSSLSNWGSKPVLTVYESMKSTSIAIRNIFTIKYWIVGKVMKDFCIEN